jgi:hypothetical protein
MSYKDGYLFEPSEHAETIGNTDYGRYDTDTPAQHFCLMCDERINPLIEHDCPANLPDATYLDRVYGDVQKALSKSNNAVDLATWKLRHRRVS